MRSRNEINDEIKEVKQSLSQQYYLLESKRYELHVNSRGGNRERKGKLQKRYHNNYNTINKLKNRLLELTFELNCL